MFHMLGRFAFTSSFSRRSSRGFRVGSRRFGFCCCDRDLPNVLIISHLFHLLFAINSVIAVAQSQHLPARRSLAMFRNTHAACRKPFSCTTRTHCARRRREVRTCPRGGHIEPVRSARLSRPSLTH